MLTATTVWWRLEHDAVSTEAERRVFKQCSAAVIAARMDAPWLPAFDLEGVADVSGDAKKLAKSVLKSIELPVKNMATCLPAMVEFTRQFKVMNADITASDVTRLLDISADLIKPASDALQMAATRQTAGEEPKGGDKIDFDSIQRVFHQQARVLLAWKTKHEQDIEIKLAEGNPAKLASVADAVGNIARFLGE